MLSHTDKTFKRMQNMADHVRRDVERSLNRHFHTWDLLDFEIPDDIPSDDENTHYRMKIRTDDNGHVKVKTIEKEPGKPKETHVEEYDRGRPAVEHIPHETIAVGPGEPNKIVEPTKTVNTETTKPTTVMEEEKTSQASTAPETRMVSEFKDFEDSFGRMQQIANHIRRDVESHLNMNFGTWDLLDYTAPIDPSKSYYRMKIKTDDNGHVRVKTAEKAPGKDWDVHVEEYDKGKGAIGHHETKAIDQGHDHKHCSHDHHEHKHGQDAHKDTHAQQDSKH